MESLEAISLCLESGGVGLWMWNIEKDILSWNQTMCDIYSIDHCVDLTYNDFSSLIDDEDAERINSIVKKCANTHEPYQTQFKLKNGRYIKAYGSITDFHGVTMFSGVNVIITEDEFRVLTEAELPDNHTLREHSAVKSGIYSALKFISKRCVDLHGESTIPNSWSINENSIIPDGKRRRLSPDTSSDLIVETVTSDTQCDTYYTQHDEVITNLGECKLLLWIEGTPYEIDKGECITIPRKKLHRYEFVGNCHFLQVWIDYSLDSSSTLGPLSLK